MGLPNKLSVFLKPRIIVNQNVPKAVYGGGKKQSEKNINKSIRTLFKLKNQNETIKDRIIQDIRTLFKQYDHYYKLKRVANFWNTDFIRYESSDDRNKNLLLKEYLNKIKPFLRDIIINLQKSETWKIQLTKAINFISSKDIDEDYLIHSNSGNIEFM